MIFRSANDYFTKTEKALWFCSAILTVLAFCIFDRENYLNLIASLVGITSLIFNAKGNPIGQVLMVIFSILYGIISFFFNYYGEMITYIGMTLPMSIIALVSWLRNPYNGNRSEVKVSQLKKYDIFLMTVLTIAVTFVFYFILKNLNTANIIPSTVSVTTSFAAVYLTFKRSPYYAVAYALNDIVLIILWILASIKDTRYISVIVCFVAFLVNDLYGFVSWKRMEIRQGSNTEKIR